MTIDDALAIEREVQGIVAVSPEARDRNQVLANGLNWSTQIIGEVKKIACSAGVTATP